MSVNSSINIDDIIAPKCQFITSFFSQLNFRVPWQFLIDDSIQSTCHDPSHTSHPKSDRDDLAYHKGYISNLKILQSSLHKRLILLFSFKNPSFGNPAEVEPYWV